jgi:lipoate-protein ligase A
MRLPPISPVEAELATDHRLLELAASEARASFRTWTTDVSTVVVGKAVDIEREVDVEFCRARGIDVVRRQSGGRSVWIGPGTLQYAFALPYRLSAELDGISSAKRFCNRLLLAALKLDSSVVEDASGDLVVESRKAAGLAMRRLRTALLLHGTILVAADLALIDRALKHPDREPVYRQGRPHRDFLTNLPPFDPLAVEPRVQASLCRLVEAAEI